MPIRVNRAQGSHTFPMGVAGAQVIADKASVYNPS